MVLYCSLFLLLQGAFFLIGEGEWAENKISLHMFIPPCCLQEMKGRLLQ